MKTEIELLKEIIKVIEDVYGNSAYMQHLIYAAQDGKNNWYSKAKKIISDHENIIHN